MALAYFGALEGLVSLLAGHAPFDVELADRAVRGVLGLPPAPITTNSHSAGASAPPTDTFMEDQR
jgi:hypothetical protein